MREAPTVVDLFCGAGGLSHGFMQAGFDVRFGTDIDPNYGKTFTASHPDAKFMAKPIQALAADEVLREAQLARGELDVLVGGPPCQGYSVYNHGRGEEDHPSASPKIAARSSAMPCFVSAEVEISCG